MDFTEYLYTKIGKRVKTYRENKGETQLRFSTTIGIAQTEKYDDDNIIIIDRSNISKIENGQPRSDGSFLTNNQIRALSATLNCTETEFLLGNESEIKDVLKILLFKCLLHDSKISIDSVVSDSWKDLYKKSQTIYIQSNKDEDIERLGNIILKFLLTYPAFQKQFITSVFYYSDDYPEKYTSFKSETESYFTNYNYQLKSQYDKNWNTINSKLQDWYASDKGDVISILLRKPENIIYIFEAFDKTISKIIDLIFDKFLNGFSRRSLSLKEKSSKKVDYLETDILYTILFENDIYHLLSDELRKEQIDKENSLFHIQFLQLLQYQNLFLEKIHSKYRATTQSYDEFKLYSDLTKLIKFYEEAQNNHLDLYISDFIDYPDY